jgi:phosphinothricin acetyltransferase
MSCVIRIATDDDAASVADIYRPSVDGSPSTFEFEAPDASEVGGEVVGYAYGTKHRVRIGYQWSVETSVYVLERCRRRGVGQGLYTALVGILTAQGFFNAYAGITLPNPASVALHESVGFQPVGVYRNVGHKLGRWHDVGWWFLTLRPHVPSPPPPVGIANLQRDRAWSGMLAAGLDRIRPAR